MIFLIDMMFVGCLINFLLSFEIWISLFCFILILINVLKLMMLWIVLVNFIFGFKFFIFNIFVCNRGVGILLCIFCLGFVSLVKILVNVFFLIDKFLVSFFVDNCVNFFIVFFVLSFFFERWMVINMFFVIE